MLGLKLPTDPRWVNIAEKQIEEILTDHAYCEQKAASTAISLIVGYPEKSDLVDQMTALAREEMGHFQMVHNRILQRGLVLGRERKELSEFYHTLMISEANHYTMFLKLARQYGERTAVDRLWNSLLEYEAEVISTLGKEGLIHG